MLTGSLNYSGEGKPFLFFRVFTNYAGITLICHLNFLIEFKQKNVRFSLAFLNEKSFILNFFEVPLCCFFFQNGLENSQFSVFTVLPFSILQM